VKQIRDFNVLPEKMYSIPDITVLMQKCAQGKISDVKNLLDENADVMAADAQGPTALLYAIRSGHAHLVSLS
jgi:ankyrin repeat protein